MKSNKYISSIPILSLIGLWILTIFFRPVEDLPFTYLSGFFDAIINNVKYQMVIFGLPVLSLAALSWAYYRHSGNRNMMSASSVRLFAKIALIISVIYSLIILLADGLYSSLMHYSRDKADSHWGVDVNEDVIDEIALIFYWFNLLVPILYVVFIYFFNKNDRQAKTI